MQQTRSIFLRFDYIKPRLNATYANYATQVPLRTNLEGFECRGENMTRTFQTQILQLLYAVPAF